MKSKSSSTPVYVPSERGDGGGGGSPVVAYPVAAVSSSSSNRPLSPPSSLPFGGSASETTSLNQATTTRTTTTTTYSASDISTIDWVLRVLLNFTWIFFGGGLPVSLLYLIAGLAFTVTIVGAPCGIVLLNLSLLSLFPFSLTPSRSLRSPSSTTCVTTTLPNILFLPLSCALLLLHAIAGLACACTIVGVPFAYAHFMLAEYAVCPFGKVRNFGEGGGVVSRTTTTYQTTAGGASNDYNFGYATAV